MTRLDLVLQQVTAAREYTCGLLASISEEDWFRLPNPPVTHVAWQVGHLAMAEYRLALERIRGRRDADEDLISTPFLRLFGRESIPQPDAAAYPSPAEIRRVFDRVHAQVLAELPGVADADLDAPPLAPHKLFGTKLESLLWSARHEMLHAGQIGLLRRLWGRPPMW